MANEGGRTWRTWQMLVVAMASLVIGILAGASTPEEDETVSAGGQGAETTTRATLSHDQVTSPPTTPTTAAPTTTTAAGPKTVFGDGSYRVGVDIAPGTYRSSGTSSSCYWQRLSNFTGTDNIIANYLSDSPTTVTILPSDAGFETRRCGTWTKV